jgi:nitroreductase
LDVSAAILKRTSIRNWKPKPVEREKIEKVLEAGWRAPSWGNTQPWRFIVVQDKEKIAEIAKAAGGQPHLNAPVLIVCCGVISDISRKQHRAALAHLRDTGVMDWTDEFLDNAIIGSEVFAPYRLGEQVMKAKVSENVMIAMAYMTLEAVNQGLGTCWVGAITPEEVHKVMNLPDDIFVHELLPLGYPNEDPKPRPRKDRDKIIFWEKYP